MLPKERRLTTHMVKDVLMKGKIYHGEHFLLRYLLSPTDKTSKYAVIISKKQLKTAVSRNIFRRRVYSIIRKYETLVSKPYFVAIMAKKGAENLKVVALDQEIMTIFKGFSSK
jgi:ribonuclease P protein component